MKKHTKRKKEIAKKILLISLSLLIKQFRNVTKCLNRCHNNYNSPYVRDIYRNNNSNMLKNSRPFDRKREDEQGMSNTQSKQDENFRCGECKDFGDY